MNLCCANPEDTLAAVRELSENAMLRPAPRRLRCAPVREYRAPKRAPINFARERLLMRLMK